MGNNCVNGREVKFCNAERDLDCMYSIRYLDFFLIYITPGVASVIVTPDLITDRMYVNSLERSLVKYLSDPRI
jgi:hypothetical protein